MIKITSQVDLAISVRPPVHFYANCALSLKAIGVKLFQESDNYIPKLP